MHSCMTVFECVEISRKIACATACLSPSEPAHAISAESLSILSFTVCSDNLILTGRGKTEIIRDRISELFPIFRQRFSHFHMEITPDATTRHQTFDWIICDCFLCASLSSSRLFPLKGSRSKAACCCCGYSIFYYGQGPKCAAQGRQH